MDQMMDRQLAYTRDAWFDAVLATPMQCCLNSHRAFCGGRREELQTQCEGTHIISAMTIIQPYDHCDMSFKICPQERIGNTTAKRLQALG